MSIIIFTNLFLLWRYLLAKKTVLGCLWLPPRVTVRFTILYFREAISLRFSRFLGLDSSWQIGIVYKSCSNYPRTAFIPDNQNFAHYILGFAGCGAQKTKGLFIRLGKGHPGGNITQCGRMYRPLVSCGKN